MIFEGEKTEKIIFNSLKTFFLNEKPNRIIYGFHCGEIYSLYDKLNKDDDLNLFYLLKKALQSKNADIQNIEERYIEATYLFFDYDGHATSADDNKLKEMIELFNDEFDKGKLYISYPMSEAIKHLKDGVDFKNTTETSDAKYKSIVSSNCNNNFKNLSTLTKENWDFIINEHCKKANFIVDGIFKFPKDIIEQNNIFYKQKEKYIKEYNKVAVLSAFPLFLLDYYGVEKLKKISEIKD